MTGTLAGRARRVEDANGDGASRRVEPRVGLPSGRAVVGGLLMALAAVGTFLAYAGASADDSIEVLIAHRDLRAGETIAASDVQLVAVELPNEVRGLFGSVEAVVGRQVIAPVDAGEFVQASATSSLDGGDALEVAVTLPGSRSVGHLSPGQRVDVFSTWGGAVTELIAVDARVLEVTGGSGTISGGELLTVRLALDDFDQVEALVHGQAAGDLTLIRAAIGTEAQDVGREYRPLVSDRGSGSASDPDRGDETEETGD